MKNFLAEAKSWSKKNNKHGRGAFQTFVMLKFNEALQKNTDEFIFKGGHLLWHYIKTPRETIDLDYVTMTVNSHDLVQTHIEAIYNYYPEVSFTIKEFKKIDDQKSIGCMLKIGYETTSGQKNEFKIDIVYTIPTDIAMVKSTLESSTEYKCASIENIISDKLSACFKYGTGNTRMKDYDDLYRIAKKEIKVDPAVLQNLLESRGIEPLLDKKWCSDGMRLRWSRHIKRYKDLSLSFDEVVTEINNWLELGFK